MLQVCLHLGVLILYTAAATCLGAALLRIVRRNDGVADITYPALLASAFFLGEGCLSNIWLLISLTGYFTPIVVVAVLACCILVGGWTTATALGGLCQSMRTFAIEQARQSWVWKVIACAGVVLVIATTAKMLIMPLSGDAIAFYLPLPKLIAHEQAMIPLPTYDWLCPIHLQGEMHWAALFLLGTGSHALWFAWPIALGTACLLLNIAALGGVGRLGQWIVLVMLFTSTTFTFYIGDGKVDLFGAGLGMACCYWMLQAGRLADSKRCLLLAGGFAGIAVSAKISLLVVLVPACGVLVLWHALSATTWLGVARQCAFAGLLLTFSMLTTLVPNVVKNIVLFDEPLAPFVMLHGQASDVTTQRWFSPETTAEIVAIYPAALVFGRYPMMGGNLSPLLLMLAPLVFFLPRPANWRSSVLCQIACLGIVGLLTWLIVKPSVVAPRYILPPLFLLMIPLARGAEWACCQPQRHRLISFACVAGMVLVSFVHIGTAFSGDGTRKSWQKIMLALQGTNSQDDHIYCRASEAINQRAAGTDRVLVGAYYTYWLREDLLAGTNGKDETADFSKQPTPQERWAFLHRHGFRFILLDRESHPWMAAILGINQQTGAIEQMPSGMYVEPHFQEGTLAVYELRIQ